MSSTAASPSVPAEPPPPAGKGLLARAVGVFVSPRATYADVAARPRALGALALGTLLIAGSVFAFMSTEVGQLAIVDQQVKMIESFGRPVDDAMYDQMEAGAARARYFTLAGQVVGIPLVTAIIAGILIGVFNALLGGDATYKQVFAIVAHSGLINAVQTLFSMPFFYLREAMTSPTNLGVFAPFLEETSFAARLLGSIDLFQIWATLSLAIGLGVLYKRRTGPIAWAFFIVYFVIVAVIAGIRTALSS